MGQALNGGGLPNKRGHGAEVPATSPHGLICRRAAQGRQKDAKADQKALV